MAEGCLIALEGIDGAGTSSQTMATAEALRTSGYTVTTTHEPSAGPIGAWLRAQLADPSETDGALQEDAMALLFAADRLDHIERCIAPALAQGHIVLSDRYVWSSFAYQASILPAGWVQTVNAMAPPAAWTLYLSVPLDIAKARRLSRGGAPERFDHDDRQSAAAARYDTLAKQQARTCLTIDASQSISDVTASILAGLKRRLPVPHADPRSPIRG